MKILITGATGFVGKEIVKELIREGIEDVVILSRNPERAQSTLGLPFKYLKWNPEKGEIDSNCLDGVDVIFNLAGTSVADGRWSKERKESILESRVLGTRLLCRLIEEQNKPVSKFINASAIGIYGDRKEEVLDEHSHYGNGFLADVCKAWEAELLESTIASKKVVLRTGVVLGDGGALNKMYLPFSLGLGGILGDGKQYMSWIHVKDLARLFIWAAKNEKVEGVYNAVAPNASSNYNFTKTLGKVLGVITAFPAPAFVIKLLFGEMSEILLHSQNIRNRKLQVEGFNFKYPNLEKALRNICALKKKGLIKMERFHWIRKRPQEVFPFFSEAKNLEKITPKFLNFKIVSNSQGQIKEGQNIDYKLKVHGLPLSWKSEIAHLNSPERFVDIQRQGPYTFWRHTHEFKDLSNGTLMIDRVVYKVPFGKLGQIVAGNFVKNDLDKIFNYRKKKINDLVRLGEL